jgi:type IV pilus assembly protein PilA
MLHTLKQRRDQARSTDDGFTLIELMVVVLIIAILLAIAIPTFLGAQNKAKDRSAQSSLRNALTAAKTIYSDTADYTDADSTVLADVEPSLTFVVAATDSADPKTVSINPSDATTFYAAAMSKTGTCFYIKDAVATGGGTWYHKVEDAAACSGTSAAGLDASFTDSWS